MANPTLVWFVVVIVIWILTLLCESQAKTQKESDQCPVQCSCLGEFVDCSNQGLGTVPDDMPRWVENLDLSSNHLHPSATDVLKKLPFLKALKLNKNSLSEIPSLSGIPNLTSISLSHNDIDTLNPLAVDNLPNLKVLDLSNNHISEIPVNSLPNSSNFLSLNLNHNRIAAVHKGSLDSLSKLVELKLNRNLITEFPKELFKHQKHLKILELNRNLFTIIEGLSFHGLDGLNTLRIRRNAIRTLLDGAFWGLKNIGILQLDFNNITRVTKAWLYGLSSLHHLTLSNNRISVIDQDAWEFCQDLVELDLSNNKLQAIEKSTFEHLPKLQRLRLDSNRIAYIAEGAFNSTPSLEMLELNCNKISWTIEDVNNGAFAGLNRLIKFGLASNHIKSINNESFIGLERIKKLDLSNNNISSVQENAFESMFQLEELLINTTSLLCDCNLKWFHGWLEKSGFLEKISTVCAYPEWLIGKSLDQVPLANFTCDDFPKPRIVEDPKTQVALKGENISLHCKATSSSHDPMTFQWKKDNMDIRNGNAKEFAWSPNGKSTEQSSELMLVNITDGDSGKYQCIVSNSYGKTYSLKSNLSVLIFPTLTKVPGNVTVKSGETARLECAADGHPNPQIEWQKDGGNDFPAARERRLHVMPSDIVFFIINVKAADMGIYSCTARNLAGVIVANASLTVLESPSFVKPMENKEITAGDPIVLECMASGSPKPKLTWTKDGGPLVTTERHFFTADDQLLIIVGTDLSDAGTYGCKMANELGTQVDYSRLSVIPATGSVMNENDMTGIIIITVVCCAVGTSIVWVVIIYQTRKRMGMVEVGNDRCPYPSMLLPSDADYKDSAPHLYLDTNSEHSSSKDSGTGDSAKRSSDDLLDNTLSLNLKGESSKSIDMSNNLLHQEVPVTLELTASVPLSCNAVVQQSVSQRTDHDRCPHGQGFSQRWSAPHCILSPLPSISCSYHSLPKNLESSVARNGTSQTEALVGESVDEATSCITCDK